MSDPIEKLNRLGDALEGAPMPVPASEIRARGDRIRRRKHTVIAGASAAVVAAVTVPVVAFTLNDNSADPDQLTPQPSPSVSDPVPSAGLTDENLITDEDAGMAYGGAGDWVAYDTSPGDGQSAFHPCTQTSLSGLGADAVFRREFSVEPDWSLPGSLTAIAGEFPEAAAATSAFDDLSTALADCAGGVPDGTGYQVESVEDVPIDVSGEAHRILATYIPDKGRGYRIIVETGLVVTGDRLEIITSLLGAQDYDEFNPPIERIARNAATRLLLGNGGTVEPTPGGDWPTSIPANFPLISGWPTDDGTSEYQLDQPSSDNQAMIPAGDLQACLFSPVDPGALERLTTRLTYGSDTYVRELELFPTDQVAVTYVAQLRALYEACPTDDQNGSPPTFTTEVNSGSIGDESAVITRASDGIGRVVINVVRVGNAVVVDLASDEGSGDTVIDLATVTRENLADVVGAMNELQGGSSGPTPDLSDPAELTTIPDDFPLDLALSEPPVEDSETTVEGPAADVEGVRPQTACGVDLSMPGSVDPEHQSGYSVSTIGGYDGRTIHAYPTVQEALDQMAALRSQVQGCDGDNEGDGLANRVWETFNSDTGYDSMTFGWTYEATEFQGPAAGQLYTVVRVGNAILAVEWGSEGSAQSQRDAAPNQVELAQLIGNDMCVFSVDGC